MFITNQNAEIVACILLIRVFSGESSCRKKNAFENDGTQVCKVKLSEIKSRKNVLFFKSY